MGFFKRKKVLNSVAKGNLIPLEHVSDPVFSSKMMGNGYAIIDHNGEVFAPVDGVITNIFQTKHAITITSSSGEDILVHMGIDTVDLKGEGFQLLVTEKQKVKQGELIAKINLSYLEKNNKDTTLIVVVPEKKDGLLLLETQEVVPNDVVFRL